MRWQGLGALRGGAGLWLEREGQTSDKARWGTGDRGVCFDIFTNCHSLGEVDHIERLKNGDIGQILHTVLTKFEDRCMQRGVNINMMDHLIDILRREEIFGTPLNMLANKIKEEKKKIENNYE